jgi:lipopolysaccharide heptosyltransferase II
MKSVQFTKILVRATNWVGDAVMSIPALRALRDRFPQAEIAILARPWVADLYASQPFADRVIPYTAPRGTEGLAAKLRAARDLCRERFDCAILLQNAFEAAAIAALAGIPERIGYARDGRAWLLTRPIGVPHPGEIPRHECFYYLELLRRAGITETLPASGEIRLEAAAPPPGNGPIGVSPGAAYGSAKRWLPENFAAAAIQLAHETKAPVAVFGTPDERALCQQVAESIARRGIEVHNYAGETALARFIELAAACRVFLTNDSGAMHIASAAGVPTVAIFGATDDLATGPTGPRARVIREPVDCSPCLLRECPIDHRCMTRVAPGRVVDAARELMESARYSGESQVGYP